MTPEDQDRIASEQDFAEERFLMQAITELRLEFQRAAKPYIDRLVLIQSMKRPPSIVLTLDQAQTFFDLTMGDDRTRALPEDTK